ncbi:MAG: hypothetical protein PHZ28_05810 [Candidatus Izemoplasmatales bacterium]|nr:hypothetical protein [Candidatus Izemoplasmatales bacterium]
MVHFLDNYQTGIRIDLHIAQIIDVIHAFKYVLINVQIQVVDCDIRIFL